MAHPDDRFETLTGPMRPERERVLIATSLAGLALVLGGIASIHMPPSDQALQDIVFGLVLGAVYTLTALSCRTFEFRVVAPGFWLLLLVTPIVWFVALKHQFAFASMTAFVVGQGISAGIAILLRDRPWWIGVFVVALGGLTVEWTLFAYADPRIVLLTGIEGSDSDRLLGSSITFLAAVVGAAMTGRWLARRDASPVMP